MNVENLIKALNDGDNVTAQKEFNTAMGQKVTDALDAKKIDIASGMVSRDEVNKQTAENEE
jgi:hypothetical protein